MDSPKAEGQRALWQWSMNMLLEKKNKDQFHRVSIVSTDISGAFDRVWHQKLIVLLHRLNLPDLFIKIMANFLKNRYIRIRIYNYLGPPFLLTAGVPQGAPDSPDLFNITTLPFGDFTQSQFTYGPWYCDDHHMIVATPCHPKTKHLHKCHITKAIKN